LGSITQLRALICQQELVQCLAHELDDPRAVSGLLRGHRLGEHADTDVRRIVRSSSVVPSSSKLPTRSSAPLGISACSAVIPVSISAASRTFHSTPVDRVVLAATAASRPTGRTDPSGGLLPVQTVLIVPPSMT
jgi:hypothetical protein